MYSSFISLTAIIIIFRVDYAAIVFGEECIDTT